MKDAGVRQQESGSGDKVTILLVEDEEAVRSMAKMFLERNGYSVIEAESGPDAVAIWEKKQSQIDLMVTDLVMPNGFTGQKLARRLQFDRPDLKVIFSSGYDCEDFAESEGDYLDPDSNFLQKPYRLSSLAQMIRESIETEKAA
jgi:two-component system, cell cycle sensor histidine kinase and response regulator CckA